MDIVLAWDVTEGGGPPGASRHVANYRTWVVHLTFEIGAMIKYTTVGAIGTMVGAVGIVAVAEAAEGAEGGDMMMIGIVEVIMAETEIGGDMMMTMVAVVDAGVDTAEIDLIAGAGGMSLVLVPSQDTVVPPTARLRMGSQLAQQLDRRR
jgi:hypothetical protein